MRFPANTTAALLDFYMWLSYRCFKAKGTEAIPIFGEFGLAISLAASNTAGLDGLGRCSNSGSTPSRDLAPVPSVNHLKRSKRQDHKRNTGP
jgi:hypothetical protein